MRWKQMCEREFILFMGAWLIGRVDVLQDNPFALSLFVALAYEQVSKRWSFFAIALGLWSSCTGLVTVKYTGAMLLAGLGIFFTSRTKARNSILLYSLCAGSSLAVIEAISGIWIWKLPQEQGVFLLALLLTGVMVPIFAKGVHFFLAEKKMAYANNEEWISSMVMVGLVIQGLPFQDNPFFSLLGGMFSFCILWIGYGYGAGAGSLAGAIGGIFFVAGQNNLTRLAIYVLLGVVAGLMRQAGRLLSALGFLLVYVACGVYFDQGLMAMEELLAQLVVLFVFLAIPRHFTKTVESIYDNARGEQEALQQREQQICTQLKHFAEPFFRLSKAISGTAIKRRNLEKTDIEQVLGQVTENLCSRCEKKNRCHGVCGHEKYQTASCILPAVQAVGTVTAGDFPIRFANKCDYMEQYVLHTNLALRCLHMHANWMRRMEEGREAIALQMEEVGQLLQEYSKYFQSEEPMAAEDVKMLKQVLKRNHVYTAGIQGRKNNHHIEEIRVDLRSKKGRAVTTKEIAKCISTALEKHFVPVLGSRLVVGNQWEQYTFVEAPAFRVLTGVARCNKAGEIVCGDNYSFMRLDQGELVMLLADGTGCGEAACESSTAVLELLESFLEAGVAEKTALELMHSLCLLQTEEEPLSTLDMVCMNLYTGVCEFLKLGGATAYIKRGDCVEQLENHTLPFGVFARPQYTSETKKLYPGDWIILLSDGVFEGLSFVEKELEHLLTACACANPNTFAKNILDCAKEKRNGEILDDMTVLVARM